MRGALLASGDFVNARIAVRDRVPSVVYADIGLTTTYLRTWSGQGDPNDPATWAPAQTFPGTDPDVTVAGGRLLVLNEDSTGKLFLRDAAGGAAVPVSTGSAGNGLAIRPPRRPRQPRLERLGGRGQGHLAARPHGAPRPGAGRAEPHQHDRGHLPRGVGDRRRRRRRGDRVGQEDPAHGLRERRRDGRPGLGAAAGGAPPLAPDVAVACQKVSFGVVQAELQDGCFLGAQQGRAKVSTGPMRLNGLEIIPDAGVQVIVDPVTRTIRSTGTVSVVLRAAGIPDITLFRGSIQLDASGKGAGASLIKWAEGLFKPDLLGFPLRGGIDVRLTNGGVRIPE